MSSVLIIDDHPIVLQAWRQILQDAGVGTVFDARDVASGYRIYRRNCPEVVIVDLSMQERGLGGLPLIKRIRAHNPRTRILVFSMHSDPTIAARALEAEGFVLTVVPVRPNGAVDPAELAEALKSKDPKNKRLYTRMRGVIYGPAFNAEFSLAIH
jgi:DNA-binding NarL/FixJ family response regulator